MFIRRLYEDWDRAVAKKASGQKDAWVIHAACGGFLAIMDQLKRSVPQKDFSAAESDIKDQFHLGCLDHDILAFLEASVPPVSLEQVPFVRTPTSKKIVSTVRLPSGFFCVGDQPFPLARNTVQQVEQRKMRAAQEKTRELNDKVLMATAEEMKHRFERDMETLRQRIPTKEKLAKEAALDRKYLADRQKSHGICYDFLDCSFFLGWVALLLGFLNNLFLQNPPAN